MANTSTQLTTINNGESLSPPQQQTNVASNAPNVVVQAPVTVPIPPRGLEYVVVGQWRDSVFDLKNQVVPVCCMSFTCACVIAGQICQKANITPCWVVPIFFVVFTFGGMVGTGRLRNPAPLLVLIILFGIIAFISRIKVRQLLKIPGNIVTDCLLSFFCTACTTAQMARQLFGYKEQYEDISFDGDATPDYYLGGASRSTPVVAQSSPRRSQDVTTNRNANQLMPQGGKYTKAPTRAAPGELVPQGGKYSKVNQNIESAADKV